jgi:hypothetical protein
MQPTPEKAAWRQVLGVGSLATENEIRQAYLNLVRVWHPDRFVGPDLKALAEEKLKEINHAYESLDVTRVSEFDASGPNTSVTPPTPSAVPRGRAVSKWSKLTPIAVALATLVVLGGVFYLVQRSGSRSRSRKAETSAAENIPTSPKARPAPKPQPASQLAEVAIQPETGLLEKADPPFGPGRLTVTNDTDLDAYSRLIMKTPAQKQLLAIYIRSGESYSVTRLPLGEYMLQTEVGRGWLTTAGRFATDHQQLEPAGPLTYRQVQTPTGVQTAEYTVALSAQAPKTVFRFPWFRGETK